MSRREYSPRVHGYYPRAGRTPPAYSPRAHYAPAPPPTQVTYAPAYAPTQVTYAAPAYGPTHAAPVLLGPRSRCPPGGPTLCCMARCSWAQSKSIGCASAGDAWVPEAHRAGWFSSGEVGGRCYRKSDVVVDPKTEVLKSFFGSESYLVDGWEQEDSGRVHLCTRHYYYIKVLKPLVWAAVVAALVFAGKKVYDKVSADGWEKTREDVGAWVGDKKRRVLDAWAGPEKRIRAVLGPSRQWILDHTFAAQGARMCHLGSHYAGCVRTMNTQCRVPAQGFLAQLAQGVLGMPSPTIPGYSCDPNLHLSVERDGAADVVVARIPSRTSEIRVRVEDAQSLEALEEAVWRADAGIVCAVMSGIAFKMAFDYTRCPAYKYLSAVFASMRRVHAFLLQYDADLPTWEIGDQCRRARNPSGQCLRKRVSPSEPTIRALNDIVSSGDPTSTATGFGKVLHGAFAGVPRYKHTFRAKTQRRPTTFRGIRDARVDMEVFYYCLYLRSVVARAEIMRQINNAVADQIGNDPKASQRLRENGVRIALSDIFPELVRPGVGGLMFGPGVTEALAGMNLSIAQVRGVESAAPSSSSSSSQAPVRGGGGIVITTTALILGAKIVAVTAAAAAAGAGIASLYARYSEHVRRIQQYYDKNRQRAHQLMTESNQTAIREAMAQLQNSQLRAVGHEISDKWRAHPSRNIPENCRDLVPTCRNIGINLPCDDSQPTPIACDNPVVKSA